MKNFYQILINTLIANVTTSYLWFGLTFWVYLETQSVLATGFIGGAYMLLVALASLPFGTYVDKHRKKQVMLVSSLFTFFMFALAGGIYFFTLEANLLSIEEPYLWIFAIVVLAGGVVENMRNIALSTTVTLLVDKDKRANANGMVGTVQGIGFIVTSVFSGLSIGLLGMGWTLVIATTLTGLALIHLWFVQVPEKKIAHDPELDNKKVDIKGAFATISAISGLMALIFFSTFNNLIGGVYMALMDPYGLTIFTVEQWGLVFGVAGTGFIIGGMMIAKFGLGKNPIRTLLLVVVAMGLLGSFFTIREWWWLYAFGIWIYMALVPAVEAAEQTVIQRVVPYERQGRVFGFAQAVESSAAPITAFMIAPIAEFFVIPFMKSEDGQSTFGWLLGSGQARGIALVFFVSGLVMVAASIVAFYTKAYKKLSKSYQVS